MRLFLIRHAKAVPGDPDELRPLADKGVEQARRLGAALALHPTPPVVVLTSPLLRARQTAEPIARATGAELRVDERLAPGADASDLRDVVSGLAGPVATVGSPARLLRDRDRADRCRPGIPGGRDARARDRRLTCRRSWSSDLRKSYGGTAALRGVSFEVAEGEVFGLLGPNGAGKTTTVEILEGFRARDAGTAEVLGIDPGRGGPELRERIGIVLQHSELAPILTVREVHRMFAGYYREPRDIDEVIELVGLTAKADARVKTLSGGQKRRLDLGVALVGDPDVVFLDEPTTGFDPAARRSAWEMVRSLRGLGKTILLTTHYLDEAQQLSDRVAVLREGVIVRQGTPQELIGETPTTVVRYRRDGEMVTVETTEPTRVLHELTAEALADGRELDRLEVVRPTLEDVYLDLVDGEDGA